MSTNTALSSSHPIALQASTYPSTHLALYVNTLSESKRDALTASLTLSETPNLFRNTDQWSNVNIHGFVDRLRHQKSRLTQLYDTEIERRQLTSQLITFLDRIDRLISEYDSHKDTNLIISNHI